MNLVRKIATEETYFIRKEVLRKGINKPYKFEGDFDKDTFHLGVFQQEKLVGIATFMLRKCELITGSQYQLRGMAILPEARSLGLGNLLLETASEKLKNKKIDFLWCNAREIALKFYQKNQFVTIGKSFEIDQIGTHYKMYKKIKAQNIRFELCSEGGS